jgi:hypothetical protein
MRHLISPGIFNHLVQLAVLLNPNTLTTAFPNCDAYGDSVLMQSVDQLTVLANHAGVPGLSISAGIDNNGLPISAQLLPLISRRLSFCALDGLLSSRPQVRGGLKKKPEGLKTI